VLPITVAGDAVGGIGPVTVTREGVLLAARITVKSNAIVMALIALVATSPIAALGHALSGLRVPDKMVFLLLLTYRYIFVLEQEYLRLRRAIRVRGFVPATRLHTYRTYAYLIGMLFVRAAARADRVYQAMLCRGFHGKFYSLATFRLRRSDAYWAGGVGAVVAAIGIVEWLHPL
jgi:cobalt/nickel transport system permease protein